MMRDSQKKYFYIFPILFWLSLFFLLPMLIVFCYSFLTKGTYGGIQFIFSTETISIFKDPVFLSILWKTIHISLWITFLTVFFSVPVAYYIARSKYKQELLFLIIIPFWTNFLVRIYAWIAVLGSNGMINSLLMKLHWIEQPIKFLYNPQAVILISVYTSLPFAILPLYAVVEKFDFSLLEAARDLGATNRQAFFKIFLPNIKAGLMAATVFTLIPSLGSYAVPKLVGGTSATMLGNIIAQHLIVTRNWPLASTISSALILLTTIAVVLFVFLNKQENKEVDMNDE